MEGGHISAGDQQGRSGVSKTWGRQKGRQGGKKCRLCRASGPPQGIRRTFYKYIRGRELLESCLAH